MMYRALHTTTYTYSAPVSICHNEVYLRPRSSARQTVLHSEITVDPEPGYFFSRRDYYGNEATFFAIHEPHTELTVAAESIVEVHPVPPPPLDVSPAWEDVAEMARDHADADALDAYQFVFASHYVRTGVDFAAYAVPSFPARRPLLEGVVDLSSRIHKQFKYAPKSTTIGTPVEETLIRRQGVCQDFAHVMISALRSLGIPSRYVSGYLRSNAKSIGAEDSHAWVAAWCPGFGWFDVDPTNDVIPAENHLTLAWGRDYAEVTPVKGVAVGGGEQKITVTVKVLPDSIERVIQLA
ncbi:MAG: transglutaminase family protein [Bryobacteraceae bacterium]